MIKPEAKETILNLLDAEIEKEMQYREEELETLKGAAGASKENFKYLIELLEAKKALLQEGRKTLIEETIAETEIEANFEELEKLKKYAEYLKKEQEAKPDAREAILKTSINLSKEFYTIEEAAELLKVHSNTIRNNIKNGNLKALKIGLQWRIPRRELM